MGEPKAAIAVGGVRLLDRAVQTLRAAGCDPVLAVIRSGVPVTDAVPVTNPAPERGMRSSVQLATEAAGEVDALAITLVDLPGVTPAGVAAVIRAWRPGRIAVASFGGQRGHPTVMSPQLWRLALELAEPDEGARRLLAARPELVDEVAVEGTPADLDTPADLERWTADHGAD
jgi:molybdenum cofactor cytidylyltransferase/nicotine blue oxidoreductase